MHICGLEALPEEILCDCATMATWGWAKPMLYGYTLLYQYNYVYTMISITNMLMSYIDTRLFWEGHPNHQLFLHIRSLNRRVLIHLIHIAVPQAMWCTASWRIATMRRPSGVEDAAIWMDDVIDDM